MPEISVIVPCYNYEKYIGTALDSVLHQTFLDWECIIIDDGSMDNSANIAAKYAKRDKRFRLIRQKNSGISAARNAGIDAARGNYIAFLDADDCYVDYGLEMLLNLAHMTGADMVGGRTLIVREDFTFVPSKNQSWSMQPFMFREKANDLIGMNKDFNWCWVWRRIYKRELIGDTRFIPEFTSFGDDIGFMLDISHKTHKMVESLNVFCCHRQHPDSIVSSHFDKSFFEWFPILFGHIKNSLLDKYDHAFFHFFYNTIFFYLLVEMVVKPVRNKILLAEGKKILIESCRLIPLRYLNFKNRSMCWFLSKLPVAN
jgi:glycosyltransferase involved in cell wall biosynthesis